MMSDHDARRVNSTDSRQLAEQLDRTIRALLAAPTERAFESGKAFNEIKKDRHFQTLGFSTFEDYLTGLEAAKFKRATAYANMKLAEKFDQQKYGHFGVGKLRLLMADYVDDPIRLLEEGILVPDGSGGHALKPIIELNCRQLGQLLRTLRPSTEKRGRKQANAQKTEETVLASKITEAAQALTSSATKPRCADDRRDESSTVESGQTEPIEEAKALTVAFILPAKDVPEDAHFFEAIDDFPSHFSNEPAETIWAEPDLSPMASRRGNKPKMSQAS